MQALLFFFVDLARLRRGPQDLPVSLALLVAAAAAGAVIGAINGSRVFGGFVPALGANLIDLVLTLALLYALLQLKGHTERWLQTATAFFGLGVLAGLVILLVRTPAEALGVAGLAMLIDLVLAVWLHIALGNVLRHALDVPLLAGVLIVLSYTVLAFNLIVRVFPLATGG